MTILGIETSCDETAVCLIEAQGEKIKILGNQLYSQIEIHRQYGGVFPNLAKREHAKNLVPLLEKCLGEAGFLKPSSCPLEINEKEIKEILLREENLYENLTSLFQKIEKPKIDVIAVTNGPGLEPALWVGVSFAKALSKAWDIPIIPVNHMEGHIIAAELKKQGQNFNIQKPEFPAIALLISGGHTQLILVKDHSEYKIIGDTKDDAIGEAFDKVARILGLPYPGGPQISTLAEISREKTKENKFILPRPMIHSGDLNFSFSGIKTAVLYLVKKIPDLTEKIKMEIAEEFENAVTEVLIKKTKTALEQYGCKALIIGGGVIANKKIRNDFENLSEKMNIELFLPEISSATDNALMITVAGYMNVKNGKKTSFDIKAEGNLTF